MAARLKYTYDLNNPCRSTVLGIPLYENDVKALEIDLSITEDGQPADLSDYTAKVKSVFSNSATATTDSCTISGNVIKAIPTATYIQGRVDMFITLHGTDSVCTVWAGTAVVEQTTPTATEEATT